MVLIYDTFHSSEVWFAYKINGTNLETKKNVSSNDAVLCCNFGD